MSAQRSPTSWTSRRRGRRQWRSSRSPSRSPTARSSWAPGEPRRRPMRSRKAPRPQSRSPARPRLRRPDTKQEQVGICRGLTTSRGMCGRYASFLPAEFIARLFATVNPLPNLAPTWNMAPTMDAPVVRLVDGKRHLDPLKWGLVPYFTKDLKKARKPINARSETIAKSGVFKAAFAERRCLVPAPAYYEWRDDPDGKTPFAVARNDGDPVVFGGIWERWKSPDGEVLQTFATITTDANRQLAEIQDRMPVIIERDDWPLWLGETAGDLGPLLRPAPEDVLRVWRPELLEPTTVT